MHENDLELVKLLHQKCTNAEDRLVGLESELASCRSDLASVEESASTREGYADILRQVAETLDRQDLVVDQPDFGELKAKCEELGREHAELQTEAARLRDLLDEVTSRAPGLLEAAGLTFVPKSGSEPESATEGEDGGAGPEATANAEGAEGEPAEEPEPESDKFNIKTIKRREKTSHGPGAVYIIDGSSVVSRIPDYDFNHRDVAEAQVYEELARDLCDLGENITGSFCILSGSPLDLGNKVSSSISIVSPGTNGSGEPEDRLHYLLRLADEYTGRLRNVCVVSGEADVLAEVQNRGMHTMSLSEFFLT